MRTFSQMNLSSIKPIFVISCLLVMGPLGGSSAQAISRNSLALVDLMTTLTAGRQTESFSCTLDDRRPGAVGKVDYEIVFDNTPPLSKVLSLVYYPMVKGEDGRLTRNAYDQDAKGNLIPLFDSSREVNVLELVYDSEDENFLVGFTVEDLSLNAEVPLVWEGKRIRRGGSDLHELVVKTRTGEIVSRGRCQDW